MAGILGALFLGAWVGFQDGQTEAQHRAEVRYLDAIDPVHSHP